MNRRSPSQLGQSASRFLMAAKKQKNQNQFFKFGKAPAKRDGRNLNYSELTIEQPEGDSTMPPKAQNAANKFFKFGKAPAKRDRRNLAFKAILKAAPPPVPPEY